MTKLRIDFQAGILEVEGEESFVEAVYRDYKDKLRVPSLMATQPHTKEYSNGQIIDPLDKIESKKPAKQKSKVKESFAISKDLDLSSREGKPSLREFSQTKAPLSAMEHNAVFVYFLQKIAGINGITINHIYSCYKDIGARLPSLLKQSLFDTANRKGWLDTSNMENIVIATPGENFVEHDLPRSKKTNK